MDGKGGEHGLFEEFGCDRFDFYLSNFLFIPVMMVPANYENINSFLLYSLQKS